MPTLADRMKVVGRFSRSTNLERDANSAEPLDGYVVTARALDVVERIAHAAARGKAGGAWSLTGPYGSGKSSLALLLDAALGYEGQQRELAWDLVREASPAAAGLVADAHRRHGTEHDGFNRALATAHREPIIHTVLRALHAAVMRRHGEIPGTEDFPAADTLQEAMSDVKSDDPRRTGPSATAIVEIARCLAEDRPLMLVIDEFGKNLEAIGDGGEADPYLLQQLAEAGQGSGLPIFILTLQHLSFEDYLAGTDETKRREWAKVQGRFEDLAYMESAAQTRALIGNAFQVTDQRLRARITDWAQANTLGDLGIPDLNDPKVIAACYPLHPLTAAVLPELCNRYGQHERTLFSFLTDPDPASAASFIATSTLSDTGGLPSLGLDAVYDYFIGSGVLASAPAAQSVRWTEITTRIRDSYGLTERQSRLAKTIAVLNLVAASGTLRASRAVLGLTDERANEALADLEAAGIVVYRSFADEYRIWHGTDVDLRNLLDAAQTRIRRQPLADVLNSIDQPRPVVAARHSAEHDVLRVFCRRYADAAEKVEPLDPFSPYDGELLLVVGSDGMLPTVTRPYGSIKPIVAAVPAELSELDAAARELATITEVLGADTVQQDWVARRELGERLAQAHAELDRAAAATFDANACRWVQLTSNGPHELKRGRGSAPLSEAAERSYNATPTVRNEMLNRTDVTSQGAKARRTLLEAMIEHGGEENLGLRGYGPEMSMYRAFLARTGLHDYDERNKTMIFRGPSDPSLISAWEVLEEEFKRAKSRRTNLTDIYATLLSPPIGMKYAVVPVFVTVGLLAYSDEIAIYEHGTFKPMLTADLSERMVRNPGHFDIKHFANTTGIRRQVIDALASRLDVRPRFRKHRVANVLAIVGHLVSEVSKLDHHTRHTKDLSPEALKVRETLVTAVEPDELLFTALPIALGLEPVLSNEDSYRDADAYAAALGDALDEMTSHLNMLLDQLLAEILEASAETTRLAIAGQAAALQDEVLDPDVRAFVLTLANDSIESDADWVQAVATVVAKKAPAEWRDNDRDRFRRDLHQRVAAFQRLVALHAQQRAEGAGPFDALRVTITRSDGTEHDRLVGIDQTQRPEAERALDEILHRLAERSGSVNRANHILLALLSERLLPEPASNDHPIVTATAARRTHNG